MSHSMSHQHQTEGMTIHWATPYDMLMPVVTFGRMRRVYYRIAELVGAKPGDAILDIGCGPGQLALVMAEHVGSGGTVAGIDASPEMIARARRNAQRRHVTIDFRHESAGALSFADHSFDSVVSSFVYHHLAGGDLQQRALANIARVLKPGGRLCIVDFMPRPDTRGTRMASDMQALLARLGEIGCTDITTGYQIPSLGLVVKLLGVPPVGYVLARLPG